MAGATVTLAPVLLFLATLAVLSGRTVVAAAQRALRRAGLLRPAVVDLDGLLDQLFASWPREEDERSDDEIIAEERARLGALLRRAA